MKLRVSAIMHHKKSADALLKFFEEWAKTATPEQRKQNEAAFGAAQDLSNLVDQLLGCEVTAKG